MKISKEELADVIDLIAEKVVDEIEKRREHDGCDKCKYEQTPIGCYPCNMCKSSHLDMYEFKNSKKKKEK